MKAVFNGLEGIRLTCGEAAAFICPALGANCLSLRVGENILLREPPHAEITPELANVYGVPFLFPPNRVAGGLYQFEGREYRFPINEPARGNHIHGFLSSTEFEVVKATETEAVLRYQAPEKNFYLDFPHAFTVVREWKLSENGLFTRLTVTNDSGENMPVGVGFHTALNVCFTEDKDPASYRLRMASGEEIVYHPETIIPTGERRKDTELLNALNGEGVCPQGERISRHMTCTPGGAEMVHLPSGKRMKYQISDTLPYWMLWNGDAQSGFICPEPQSWIVDAPNQSQKTEESGFRFIEPGEAFVTEMELTLEA